MSVVVRLASPADREETAQVLAAAFAQSRPAPPGAVSPDAAASFERYVAELVDVGPRIARGELFVAVVGGVIAGAASLVRGEPGWPAHWAIHRMLGVAPAFRGRGIARRLVEARVEHARAIGAPVVGMQTPFDAARRLYRSLGWQRAPEHDIEPVPGVHAEAYVLKLAP